MKGNNEKEALDLISEILGTDNAIIIYEKKSVFRLAQTEIRTAMFATDTFIERLPNELLKIIEQLMNRFSDKFPAEITSTHKETCDRILNTLIIDLARENGIEMTQKHLSDPDFLLADDNIPEEFKQILKSHLGKR